MARYRTTFTSSRPPEEAFDYLADFASAEEWDPSVVEGRRLDEGPVGAGSRFRVVSRFMGREVPMDYRITAYDRPDRVVLEADEERVRSLDEITFSPTPAGTQVTYDADLRIKGALGRVVDPLLAVVFRRMGDRAAGGLREALR